MALGVSLCQVLSISKKWKPIAAVPEESAWPLASANYLWGGTDQGPVLGKHIRTTTCNSARQTRQTRRNLHQKQPTRMPHLGWAQSHCYKGHVYPTMEYASRV